MYANGRISPEGELYTEDKKPVKLGTLKDEDEDYRTWYEKVIDNVSEGLSDAATLFTPAYSEDTGGGFLGIKSLMRGGEEGSVIGSIYGAVLTKSAWGAWIGGLIGGAGVGNLSKWS